MTGKPHPSLDLFLHKQKFIDPVKGYICLPISSTKRYRLDHFTDDIMGNKYERDKQSDQECRWLFWGPWMSVCTDITTLEEKIPGTSDGWRSTRLGHRFFTRIPWDISGNWASIESFQSITDLEDNIIVNYFIDHYDYRKIDVIQEYYAPKKIL